MQINSSYNSYNNYLKEFHSTSKDSTNSISNNDTQAAKQTQIINRVELNTKQIQQVRELQNIDKNVKAHEAAHQATLSNSQKPINTNSNKEFISFVAKTYQQNLQNKDKF